MTGSGAPRAPTGKRSVAEASSCGSTERATGQPAAPINGAFPGTPGEWAARSTSGAAVRRGTASSGRSVPALPPPCTIRGVRIDGGPRHGEHAGTRRRLTEAERDNGIEQQQDHPGRDRGHRRTGGARGRHSDAGPSAGAGRDLERPGRRPRSAVRPVRQRRLRVQQSVEDRIIRSLGGVYGPYTGRWFGSKRETDIEHIVARSEAYDSGLCRADRATRRRFSEDLRNLTLAAPAVNRYQKRDHDAGGWLPPMNRCWFAARVIDVKRAYGLTVDRRGTTVPSDSFRMVKPSSTTSELVPVPEFRLRTGVSQLGQLPNAGKRQACDVDESSHTPARQAGERTVRKPLQVVLEVCGVRAVRDRLPKHDLGVRRRLSSRRPRSGAHPTRRAIRRSASSLPPATILASRSRCPPGRTVRVERCGSTPIGVAAEPEGGGLGEPEPPNGDVGPVAA